MSKLRIGFVLTGSFSALSDRIGVTVSPRSMSALF